MEVAEIACWDLANLFNSENRKKAAKLLCNYYICLLFFVIHFMP
jgi:hypothetical protein